MTQKGILCQANNGPLACQMKRKFPATQTKVVSGSIENTIYCQVKTAVLALQQPRGRIAAARLIAWHGGFRPRRRVFDLRSVVSCQGWCRGWCRGGFSLVQVSDNRLGSGHGVVGVLDRRRVRDLDGGRRRGGRRVGALHGEAGGGTRTPRNSDVTPGPRLKTRIHPHTFPVFLNPPPHP